MKTKLMKLKMINPPGENSRLRLKLRPKKLFILMSVILISVSSSLQASFENLGAGARALGMGNAYVAMADDANSIYYNPAGLLRVRRKELNTSYSRLYWGLKDGSNITQSILAYAQPIKNFGALGFGYNNLSLIGTYQESTYYLSYAPAISLSHILFGMNLKIMQKKYLPDMYTENAIDNLGQGWGRDPVFKNGYSKTGISLDIGAIIPIARSYNLGLALLNLNQPDMGLKGKDPVPLGFKLGVTHNLQQTNLAVDISYSQKDFDLYVGGEQWLLNNVFCLRSGLNIGTRQYRNFSVGVTYKQNEFFQIDYAFVYPLTIQQTLGTHQLTLAMRFDPTVELIPRLEIVTKKEKEMQAEELYKLALTYYQQQLYQDAITKSEEVLKLEPESQKAIQLITDSRNGIKEKAKATYEDSVIAYEQGFYKLSFDLLTLVGSLDPNDAKAREMAIKLEPVSAIVFQETRDGKIPDLVRQGIISFVSGDGKTALLFLRYASQLEPQNKGIEKLLSLTEETYPTIAKQERIISGMNMVEQKLFVTLNYMYEGRYDLAITECNEALALEPENVLALTRLGSAYLALGQREKASEFWQKALNINPKDQDILDYLRAENINIKPNFLDQEYQKSKKQEQKAIAEVKNNYLWGIISGNNNDAEKAINFWNKVLESKPTDSVSVSLKGKAMSKITLMEQKTKSPKIQKTEKTQKPMNESEKKELIRKHYLQGLIYYKNNEWEKAIVEFQEILKIDPKHPQSTRIIDQCNEKLKKKAETKKIEAPKTLSDAEKKDLMKTHYFKGLEYYKAADWGKAIVEFQEILKINPKHSQSLQMIEKCKENLNK